MFSGDNANILQQKLDKVPFAIQHILIAVLSLFFFIPFLGSVHLFDWDEINFAESAREMLITGNYFRVQINFQPFWEKPPFFFWLQAVSMKMFGINEFAARFPNAICGVLTLNFIFYIGRKRFTSLFGWLWVAAYVGSLLPHFYFKSGIIDPWFNLFIFSSVFFLFQAEINRQTKFFAFAGITTGMAILTKGPVGLLLVLLTATIFVLIKRNIQWINLKGLLLFLGLAFSVSFFWYGFELIQNGTWFINEFIEYHIRLFSTRDAGHGGPFFYHPIVIFFGCFPASIIALQLFFNNKKIFDNNSLKLWMTVLFFVVLTLFSIVKTKIVHYSSMCYLPLTFLAAYTLYNNIYQRFLSRMILFIGALIALVFTLLPIVGNNINLLKPFLKKDPFALAAISVEVNWQYWLVIFGMSYFVLVLISYFLISKQNFKGYLLLFCATAFLIFFSLPFFVPKIERYSQGSIIDFYKTLKGKEAYVEVTGFKSYAQYFYTQKPLTENNITDKYTLLNQPLNKPIYIITKIHKAKKFQEQYPDFVKHYENAGFVVFVKK